MMTDVDLNRCPELYRAGMNEFPGSVYTGSLATSFLFLKLVL